MAIATKKLGKLGGSVETRETRVSGSGYPAAPSGWKRAVGVFKGVATASPCVVFGDTVSVSGTNPPINGGGVFTDGQRTAFGYVTGAITWYRLE